MALARTQPPRAAGGVFGEARVATVADYKRLLATNRAAAAKLRAAAGGGEAAPDERGRAQTGAGRPRGGARGRAAEDAPARGARRPSGRAARRPSGRARPAPEDEYGDEYEDEYEYGDAEEGPTPAEVRAARLYAAAGPARARRPAPAGEFERQTRAGTR
ncbi:protein V57 [Cervid alphaherpesvirus 2]|uniref:Protein V57 n=1 Tax=Cervid alphaherpesvirus 2 TaxID=365327 RepID=A0A455JQ80_9ALPH|nr:protein V57 [Cervid alphaherpesvirus 2]AVT50777.1 protein V57 [Cervid alphaherpesvirus 2]